MEQELSQGARRSRSGWCDRLVAGWAIALGCLLSAGPAGAAAPDNDNFAGALTLSGDAGTTTSDLVEATLEAREPLHAGAARQTGSLWWAWSPSTTGTVTFDTAGSDFDTALGVYTGPDVTSLTEVASNDNDGASPTSLVSFTATPDNVYYIAVADAVGILGKAVLNWSLCPTVDAAINPVPADRETTGCALQTLDWDDVAGATSYDVYVDSTLIGSSASSDLSVAAGFGRGAHRWQVVANSACTSTSSTIWSFCLADAPANPSPADGETTACGALVLNWDDACGADSYDVVIDTRLAATVTESEYPVAAAAALSGSHTWQIISHSSCGDVAGPVWTFCQMDSPTAPVAPADGETTGCALRDLTWEPVCGATSYEVVLDGFSLGRVADTSLSVAGVSPGAHSWQVVAIGPCGELTGPLWNFCVLEAPTTPLTPGAGATLTTSPTTFDWDDALNRGMAKCP